MFSAFADGNDRAFPRILALYLTPGSVVADVTYGKGVFWRHIPPGSMRYEPPTFRTEWTVATFPTQTGEIDCVVLDPPYMHSPGGTAHEAHTPYEKHYRNNRSGNQTASKYHEAVLDLYRDAGREAHRILRDRGVLIVKCQDEVCSNRQRFTHVEIMQMYEKMGFVAEDLFVTVRHNRPGVSRTVRQVHARKNHSYFLVFWKRGESKAIWEPPR